MSPDLKYLLFSTILCFVQVLIAATGANQQVGLPTLAGNRDKLPEYGGWAGRARRAHLNMIENLVLFAALVLIANATGRTDALTQVGAMLFFWGRLAYAVIYIAGIPWLRTGAWTVSILGLVVIFLQLL